MTNYLALNIGRNTGTTPMPAHEWQAFQAAALDTLIGHANTTQGHQATILASGTHTGAGDWVDNPEHSAVVWLVTAETLDPFTERNLRTDAADLARCYGQDAVAVIIGESTLARA